MACSSVALLSHSHAQQPRLNPNASCYFTRSTMFSKTNDATRFPNQVLQLTKTPHPVKPKANLSSSSFITQEITNMNFFDRLKLAFKIIFPKSPPNQNTNAQIAKQRLKMVLFSDRCSVSDLAKKKILENVIKTLSEFVEIESRDKVELNVSTDGDIGTVYSVMIPVRRVKPSYQEDDENYKGQIVGIEYKDTGTESGNVDVTFDFYVPNEN